LTSSHFLRGRNFVSGHHPPAKRRVAIVALAQDQPLLICIA
jgi:hypothetical protein